MNAHIDKKTRGCMALWFYARKQIGKLAGNKILGIGLCALFVQVGQAQKLFTLLDSKETGIKFNNELKDTKEHNILIYSNFYGGAGVGVGDFNNDGLQDIYFAGNMVPDQLYFNQGDFVFGNVTKKSGIKDDGGWSTGVTVADVNNDGYLDIYISRELYDNKPEWRRNLLYINNGDGTFREQAEQYGVADTHRTRHATFLDYDKDGWLDLFLLTQPPNPGSYSEFSGTELLQAQYRVKLYRNTGKNGFEEVSEAAGVDLVGFPNGVSASDLNNDGWTDLYVANDFYAPDFVFINNQDGTFTNVADQALNHMSYYSMGVDVADINNDELLDVFVVDMVAEDNFRLKSNMSGMNPDAFWKVVDDGGHFQYMYNSMQVNNGNMTFSDVAQFTGMAATDWSWSNLLADFDNDGLKDAYVTNGLLYDIRNTDASKKVGDFVTQTATKWVQNNPNGGEVSIWDIVDLDEALALLPSQPLKNYAFKNKGELVFEQVMDDWGLDQESFSNGSAYADFDNDGDLDLVVNNINAKAFVYRNNSESRSNSNYLRVQLSSSDNRPVYGSRVTAYINGSPQLQETTNVRGIYSTSEQIVHFGLAEAKQVDSVVVLWPNGTRAVQKDVLANQVLDLKMGEGQGEHKPKQLWKELFFEDVSGVLEHKHQENSFDDYSKQVLLPHKMSQYGPAMAVADVNGDGLEDVFVGGATDEPASLYMQNANGGFSISNEAFWQKEGVYEDVDALFVDISGDGHQDLYVVSGGNKYPENDLHYVDRLYINDGQGNFRKGAVVNVGRFSGSRVVGGDYDQDGDIDLFVGGRHVPHQYPLPATSMLLRNDGGQLVNATEDVAPEFKHLGMATDAVWDDFDSDGDLDLMVVGEWMPLTFFSNESGSLVKREIPGLQNSTGWWFGLAKGDFDGDGDQDLIAGNLGLNYKYKTSPERPFDVYYDDFDQNGSFDIVLGYYNGEKHYPLRGFSCSSEQIPGLKKKFQKYDVFASLEIDEVYGESSLQEALHYKADTFATSYIENLGGGSFKIHSLPNMAQLSSVNDIMVDDFNGDSNLDALVAGNLFVSEIETPRNDAGTGVLLLGDGKGGFVPKASNVSGFFANGDVKVLKKIALNGGQFILVGNNDAALQVFRSKTMNSAKDSMLSN